MKRNNNNTRNVKNKVKRNSNVKVRSEEGILGNTNIGSTKTSATKVGVNSRRNGAAPRGNDPSWYNLDPRITRDAATFPYNIPAGSPIYLSEKPDLTNTPNACVPGIMAYRIASTIGHCEGPSDPANMAATQMYSFITHANSRNTSYDSADLMQYILAMTEVYSYLEWLKRLYGAARLYTYNNKYMPHMFFYLNGVEMNSIVTNMADFRLGINLLVSKISSYAVPDTMSIFKRRQFLFSSLYADGDDVKDQLYMFVPDGFSIYDWKNNLIKYVALNDLPHQLDIEGDYFYTADTLIAIGNAMIDLILGNNDLGVMNGDIQKAYGNNVLHVSGIEEGYQVIPGYNQGVLEQMANATIQKDLERGSLDIASSYIEDGVSEGMSILVSDPRVVRDYSLHDHNSETVANIRRVAGWHTNEAKAVVVTDLVAPEPEVNVELTRLITKSSKDSDDIAHLISGTEIVTGVEVAVNPDKVLYIDQNIVIMSDTYSVSSADGGAIKYNNVYDALKTELATDDYTYVASILQFFKYAPTLYIHSAGRIFDDNTVNYEIHNVAFKAANFTTLNRLDISNIHKVALLNLFFVPKVSG